MKEPWNRGGGVKSLLIQVNSDWESIGQKGGQKEASLKKNTS